MLAQWRTPPRRLGKHNRSSVHENDGAVSLPIVGGYAPLSPSHPHREELLMATAPIRPVCIQPVKPGLFGLERSNRDFEDKEAWGENQFNSSFPAALACYMHSKGVNPICLSAEASTKVVQSDLSVEALLGIDPLSSNTFFSFETPANSAPSSTASTAN